MNTQPPPEPAFRPDVRFPRFFGRATVWKLRAETLWFLLACMTVVVVTIIASHLLYPKYQEYLAERCLQQKQQEAEQAWANGTSSFGGSACVSPPWYDW